MYFGIEILNFIRLRVVTFVKNSGHGETYRIPLVMLLSSCNRKFLLYGKSTLYQQRARSFFEIDVSNY